MTILKAHIRAKCCTMCLILAMITAFSASSSAFSPLLGSALIPSTGMVGLPGVIALSGLPEDIQEAVNTVDSAGGGTVYVPAGTFHWNGQTVTIPGGVNVMGASFAGCMGHEYSWEEYSASTILRNDAVPSPTYNVPNMFVVDGNNGKATRISGIRFEATGPPDYDSEWGKTTRCAIDLIGAKNFRVDHCTFIDFAGTSVRSLSASWYGATGDHSAYGLIDHCVIDLPYKLNPSPEGWEAGYGFYALGNMRTTSYVDDIVPFAGKYQAIQDTSIIYVEDCKISKTRHAIDTYCGGAACVRYTLIAEPFKYLNQNISPGELDQHGGFDTGDSGGVLLEAYNNTIMGKDGLGTLAYRIRGGHGLCHNNIFNPPYHSQNYFITINGEANPVNQLWIWDNQYSNCEFLWNTAGAVENLHYFLREPTQALDGWTYTPYTYPHPIIAG